MRQNRYHLTVDQLPLPERARLLVEAIVQDARAVIHSGDEVDQRFLLCNSEHEKILTIKGDFTDNQGSKERFVADIRRQAHTMEADMVIMLTEGWQPAQELTDEEWSALKKRHGSIANMPGAVETLLIRVETADVSLASMAQITGKGSMRRSTPSLFARMNDEEREVEQVGIFSQLLPTPEQVSIVQDTLARAEKLFIANGLNPHKKIFRFTPLESMELLLWTVPGFRLPDDRLEVAVKAAAHLAKS